MVSSQPRGPRRPSKLATLPVPEGDIHGPHPAWTLPFSKAGGKVEGSEGGLTRELADTRGAGGTAGRVSTGQNSGTLAIWGTLTPGLVRRPAGALMLP